jgi:hypothetical protein
VVGHCIHQEVTDNSFTTNTTRAICSGAVGTLLYQMAGWQGVNLGTSRVSWLLLFASIVVRVGEFFMAMSFYNKGAAQRVNLQRSLPDSCRFRHKLGSQKMFVLFG